MVARIENVVKGKRGRITYTMLEVPIERIRPCPYQPRKYFDPEEEKARAESIRAVGQQEAATVDRILDDPDHDYELINGESRWRSAKRAGQKTLWVAIRSEPFGSKREKHLAALVANHNRSDHTPMEIAEALRFQLDEGGSAIEVATALGKTDNWVYQYLSLLKLHPDIQAFLHPTTPRIDRVSATIGFSLARISMDKQKEVLEKSRSSDGRVSKSQVDIEVERLLGKRQRRMNPSDRRRSIERKIRSIRTDARVLDSLSIADVRGLLCSLKADDRAETINNIDEAIHILGELRSVAGGRRSPSRVEEDGLDGAKARKNGSSEGRNIPWERAPEALSDELPREVFHKRLEEWHDFWLSLIPPERKVTHRVLLLEIAYPKNRNTLA